MSMPANQTHWGSILHERRERVFLVLAGLFLGTMAMLNLLSVTRFLDFSVTMFGHLIPFKVPVGVLPYPLTFLCTDFISELYGRKRANFVVMVGLVLNLWVLFIVWLGGVLPPDPGLEANGLPPVTAGDFAFFRIRALTLGAVTASMVAYLAAQFCDVFLFHFWKRLTRGRHLWLRNNGSTMVSQFIDSFCVITITYLAVENGLPIEESEPVWPQLWVFIGSGYVFKFVAAMLDTIPFYIGVILLSRYLQLDPMREHDADREEERSAALSGGAG